MSDRLLIFAREPKPGQTKTRLIPAIGPERAARLSELMTARTISWGIDLGKISGVQLEVCFAGGTAEQMRSRFGTAPTYRPQAEGDLGHKMMSAFRDAFEEKCDRVVIVGTDSPGLDGSIVAQAMESLTRCEIVLGPAWDGGYYLIGLRRPIPQVFEGIAWGTEQVLDTTLLIAERLDLSVGILQLLPDVDLPADLVHWTKAVRAPIPPLEDTTTSVIIPALNEEKNLPKTLEHLSPSAALEVIVVDGGSTDMTMKVASDFGATVYSCDDGRGAQLNLGASIARGGRLLFLHADTRLPHGFESTVQECLADPAVSAGAFRLSIESARSSLRLVEWGANLRSRLLQLPYGDQAIFTTAQRFWKAGGFPEWTIMEDFALVRSLQKLGRIAITEAAVSTSARRWETRGIWRSVLLNQAVLLGHALGVSPQRLASWYRQKRTRKTH